MVLQKIGPGVVCRVLDGGKLADDKLGERARPALTVAASWVTGDMERIKQAIERAAQQSRVAVHPKVPDPRAELSAAPVETTAFGERESQLLPDDAEDHLGHFGLARNPFSLLPDPLFFLSHPGYRDDLAALRARVLRRSGTTLVTGESGLGKTALVQALVHHVGPDVVVGTLGYAHPRLDNLLDWVLRAFGIEPREPGESGLYRVFRAFVEDQYRRGLRALLVVDEADRLSSETLAQLLTLSNVTVDYPAFQVVLSGLPSLLDLQLQPGSRQPAGGIALVHRLRPLTADETRAYIRYRLQVAGGDPNLFSDDACRLIHAHADGVPRAINVHADALLENAFERQCLAIDVDLACAVLGQPVGAGLQEPVASVDPTAPAAAGPMGRPSQPASDPDAQRIVPPSLDAPAVAPSSAGINGKKATRQRPASLDEAKRRLSELLD